MIFNLSIFFILSSFKIIFVILSTYSLSSSCFPKMEPTLSINIFIPVYSIISDTIIVPIKSAYLRNGYFLENKANIMVIRAKKM